MHYYLVILLQCFFDQSSSTHREKRTWFLSFAAKTIPVGVDVGYSFLRQPALPVPKPGNAFRYPGRQTNLRPPFSTSSCKLPGHFPNQGPPSGIHCIHRTVLEHPGEGAVTAPAVYLKTSRDHVALHPANSLEVIFLSGQHAPRQPDY